MTKQEEESFIWFNNAVNKLRTKKEIESGDFTAQDRRAIKPGSMIMFQYKNPVGLGKKSLKFFDQNPVDFILDIRGNGMLALNLHYVPPPMRLIFIKYVLQLNKARIKQNKRFELDYPMVKEFIIRNGLQMMIKRYRVNRITKLEYVKPADYKYIVSLPSEKFIIQDSNISKADLYAMIRSQSTKTKTAKNVRYGRSTNAVNKRTSSNRTKSRK